MSFFRSYPSLLGHLAGLESGCLGGAFVLAMSHALKGRKFGYGSHYSQASSYARNYSARVLALPALCRVVQYHTVLYSIVLYRAVS